MRIATSPMAPRNDKGDTLFRLLRRSGTTNPDLHNYSAGDLPAVPRRGTRQLGICLSVAPTICRPFRTNAGLCRQIADATTGFCGQIARATMGSCGQIARATEELDFLTEATNGLQN